MSSIVETQKLGDLITLFGGGTPSKDKEEYWGNEIPWATVKDLKSRHLNKTQDYITELGFSKSSSKMVKSGSLIIATRMAVGRVVIAALDVAINQDLKGITCSEKIDTKYLYYFLSSQEDYFNRVSSGATVKGIKIAHITDIDILLPPLPEQQKIAAILDAADQLRQKDQQLIEHYTQLGQSLFLEMFGDLSSFPSKQMNSVTNFIDYRGKTPKKTTAGVPLLTAKNVKVGYVSENPQEFIAEDDYESWMTRGFPKTGDVLFTTEAPLGQAALMPQYTKVAIAQRLICIQPDKSLNSGFLMNVLFSSFFKQQLFNRSTGSTVKGVRSKELAQINIPLPPIELQNQFAQHIEAIEQQKQSAQASLEKSEVLFNSLLQRAFKGELTGKC